MSRGVHGTPPVAPAASNRSAAAPRVSVIMPVHNGERFIRQAIDNVRAQGCPGVEVILVDDGSTDASMHIASDCGPLRCLAQENAGPAAARNRGLAAAVGEYIAFLDVDDAWPSDLLERLAAILDASPGIDIVQGTVQDVTPAGDAAADGHARRGGPYRSVNLGSALYRRAAFERVGEFDPQLRFNEDTDWFCRAWSGRVWKQRIEEVALFYLRHEENMTLAEDSRRAGFARVIGKHAIASRSARPAPEGFPSLADYLGWSDSVHRNGAR